MALIWAAWSVLPVPVGADSRHGRRGAGAGGRADRLLRAHAPDYDVPYPGQDWDECIEELPVAGDVLELACGTGHWTPLLAARARSVTALDAAPEVLALARRRVRGLPVEFIQTDVFTW